MLEKFGGDLSGLALFEFFDNLQVLSPLVV